VSYHAGVTLEQLIAFHGVASYGSFSAASVALHKSQPAISKLVQKLEGELGLTLFDRSAYRATLSDAGRLFFERTARLLEGAESLRAFAASLVGEAEPVVRIVVEAITPLPRVLAVLSDVERAFPAVRYELRTERLRGAVDTLRDDSADLVIANNSGIDAHHVEAQPLCSVRIHPVVRSDHPLARAPSPAASSLLRAYPQVVLSDSSRGEHTQTLNVLDGGLRWSVTDLMAKLQIIEAGMGWGGLPEHVVEAALRDGRLVTLTVREFEVEAIQLYTLRRRDKRRGPVVEALWERLRG